MSEEEFAKAKHNREIAVVTRGNPILPLQLLMMAYPDALILLRSEPEDRVKAVRLLPAKPQGTPVRIRQRSKSGKTQRFDFIRGGRK